VAVTLAMNAAAVFRNLRREMLESFMGRSLTFLLSDRYAWPRVDPYAQLSEQRHVGQFQLALSGFHRLKRACCPCFRSLMLTLP
jgi:hypothetical protein